MHIYHALKPTKISLYTFTQKREVLFSVLSRLVNVAILFSMKFLLLILFFWLWTVTYVKIQKIKHNYRESRLSMPAAELEDSSGTLQYRWSINVAECSVLLAGLWIKCD